MRHEAIDTALRAIHARLPLRAGSLIVTVFGDSVSQHGNAVWLGSLIKALEPFGLNARQIRTAVFRLVKEGWLSCRRIGRKSYYSFTEFGQRRYESSARRVYAASRPVWDGRWTLVLPAFVEPPVREQLRRELSWLGFGSINNGVMAHPSASQESLAETLQDLNLNDDVVVLRATTEAAASHEVFKRLAHQTWRLDEFEARYERFVADFQPLLDLVSQQQERDPGQMFALQTSAIHEYRRILLKSTDLPDELLPAGWSGGSAMLLSARLYCLTREPVAEYLETFFEGPEGKMPSPSETYSKRFTCARPILSPG